MTGDNDPIPLKHAAEIFGIGVDTLKAERARGRLTTYRIGREIRTSVNDIRAMFELCREEQKGQGFTVTRRVTNTASETERASYDSAQQALLKLRSTSRNTSRASIDPRRARGH